MNKVLNLKFESSLTELCKINSSFDTGVLRICYTGQNANGSSISREAILRALPTIYNCPIVCNYDRESNTLGGHDIELVEDKEGNFDVVNVTTPVGVIPESAKVWLEDYREGDGSTKEYLYAEALIWKRQEAYKKIKEDGITAQSMEISVSSGANLNGVYHIDDFTFTAFTLIGVTPCFPSAALEMFSATEFKKRMEDMMKDLKFTLSDGETQGGIYIQAKTMEGGKIALENTSNVPSADNVLEQDFALISRKMESVNEAVEKSETVTDAWGDQVPRYFLDDCDFEMMVAYCYDITDGNIYKFAISFEGDTVVIDWNSKKRQKASYVDYDEGENPSEQFNIIVKLQNKFSEMREAYQEVSDELKSTKDQFSELSAEAESLRAFKEKADSDADKAARDNVFAKFDDLVGVEEFDSLRENNSSYDIAELEEKCYAIRGRAVDVTKKFAKETSQKLPVINEHTGRANNPYGEEVERLASKLHIKN